MTGALGCFRWGAESQVAVGVAGGFDGVTERQGAVRPVSRMGRGDEDQPWRGRVVKL